MPSPERHQLTLSQLAEFDDLLTDSLVDRVYYWTTIRKMKHTYHPNRGVKTDAVTAIIVKNLVRNKNLVSSLEQFLQLTGICNYLAKIKSESLKADFVKHTRRYLSVYLPDSPFEVSATNRYNLTRPEACVIARKQLHKGDTIKYLTGTMVKMSADEEDAYTQGKTDFSIIYSSRVGGMSLLLGPARFVNHDCQPNSRFTTTNKDQISLCVLRGIEVGEEITVSYADDYFGDDNKECLCHSCELRVVNGWAPEVKKEEQREDASSGDMDDVSDAPAMRRTRSKRMGDSYVELPPPEKKLKRKSGKEDVLTPPYSDRALSEDPKVQKNSASSMDVDSKPKTPMDIPPTPSTNVGTPAPLTIRTTSTNNLSSSEAADIAESLLALSQSPGFHQPRFSPQTSLSGTVGDRAPDFGRALSYGIERMAWSQNNTFGSPSGLSQNGTTPASQAGPFAAIPAIYNPFNAGAPIGTAAEPFSRVPVSQPFAYSSDVTIKSEESEPSETPEPEFIASRNQTMDLATNQKRKDLRSIGPPSKRRSGPLPPPNYFEPVRRRVPGDYLNFFESDRMKCTCVDCKEDFIHKDRWYVPRSCQRCERHSKIYGFVWPKTVKRKGDSEDQIEDYRTVQRYVTASEHRKEQKRLAAAKAAEQQQQQHEQPAKKVRR